MSPVSTRGVGGIEFLRGILPEAALEALGLLTWLGSVAFLTSVIVIVYWFVSREGGAFALAAALGGFSLTIALKAGFGLARPPDSLWLIAAAGFGFPSGHAIASTVGWGSLALAIDRGSRGGRLGVAAVVVAVVALSRVALGVHYAVDVLAGVVVGVVYLGILLLLDGVGRAFGAATIVALLAFAFTVNGSDALLLLGGAAGGWFAWTQLSVPEAPWRWEGVLPATVSAAVFGGLALGGYLMQLPEPVEFGIGAVAVSGALGLPVLVERAVP